MSRQEKVVFLGGPLGILVFLIFSVFLPPLLSARDLFEKPSPRVEEAVDRGLSFLARTQTREGAWPGQHGDTNGVVALAVLAFLGKGEILPGTEYEGTLRRARDYLLSDLSESGLLARQGGPTPMYSHGFTLLALTQLYGMDPDPRIGPAIELAIPVILRSQSPRGGWRYQPLPVDEDITVTGCQLVALRAARDAGFPVPEATIKRGLAYVKSCQAPEGWFAYRPESMGHGPSLARSGIGVLLLYLTGEGDSREATRAVGDLVRRRLDLDAGGHPYYGAYYAAQAMYQAGGPAWERWWPQVEAEILSKQASDGGWPEKEAGRAYTTALALLALETQWHYLPIYQR